MTESTPPSPIAAKALQRLQKLAEGNGLGPDAIHLFSAEEATYEIKGTIILSPLFETQSIRHGGGPSSSRCRMVSSSAALKTEVEKLRKDFETRHAWINEAINQLKEQPAGGWGLDDVRITLPQQSVILAASEACPSCHGRKALTCTQCNGTGAITCPQCRGSRQEMCHICLGSGVNPVQPNQPCIQCNGTRFMSCRYCHGSGQLTCPTCNGSRGMRCSSCDGAGVFTEETAISCGARTQFKIASEGLPSGLRRGLDRLGIANLVNGHADIETVTKVEEPEEIEEEIPPPFPLPGRENKDTTKKEKAPKPEIHYVARLPYADLRMKFIDKQAVVGVFGKKNGLLGVPPFLDVALESARAKLQSAAKGGEGFEEAIAMRAISDALKLVVTGSPDPKALRRIYPYGLSQPTAAEIMRHMRLALNKLTLRSRSIAAGLCGAAGIGIYAGIFLTPLHQNLTQMMKPPITLAVDVGILLAVMVICWFALSFATRFSLQKRFPNLAVPVTQHTGKTGYSMLAALMAGFIILLMLAPDRSPWLAMLLPK